MQLSPYPPNSGRTHTYLARYKGVSGVYLLLVGKTLYVGSTKDLQRRLREWATKFPGARFAAYPCADYKRREQQYIDRLRAGRLAIANKVNAIQPLRARQPRTTKAQRPRKPRCPPRVITVAGVQRTLTEWCKLNNITKGLFYARLRIGWTESEAVRKKAHT